MTSPTPYRSTAAPVGSDGFVALLRAEWTKFRSVRGWVIAVAAGVVASVVLGVLAAAGGSQSPAAGLATDPSSPAYVPTGPGGEAVVDHFTFVHQPLAGDGSITARVTSLTGLVAGSGKADDPPPEGDTVGPAPADPWTDATSGVQPWAKAGLIVKDGTAQGSAYGSVVVTGGHGVRMQDDYTNDVAGPAWTVGDGSPVWLRLTRSGDTLTGEASPDGTTWTVVGTSDLAGLPSTVQVGLLVTSPMASEVETVPGGIIENQFPTVATATFDEVGIVPSSPGATWQEDVVGGEGGWPASRSGPTVGSTERDGSFRVTGLGDIAPAVGEQIGVYVERSLTGTFAAIIVVLVVAALFMTSEHRRGLLRTTLAASPHRGRVLLAKATVIGTVTAGVGLVGATVAIVVGQRILESNGRVAYPISTLTQVRVVVGTAAMLGLAAILALALGSILRRSAAAVAAALVLVTLPYILAISSVVPDEPGLWLLRVTPAAAFAVQQRIPQYEQLDSYCPPVQGCYPLSPLIGFAVLAAYVAVALGIALFLIRERDA